MKKDSRKLPLTDEQKHESDLLKAIYSKKKSELGLTQDVIAGDLGEGVSQGAVSHFMNRRLALNLKAATIFAKRLQVKISDFSPRLAAEFQALTSALDEPSESGQTKASADHQAQAANSPLPAGGEPSIDLDDRYAFIPQCDAKAAAGIGAENPHVEIRSTLAFKKEWLRVKGASAKNLIVLYADGHSMWPTISDGDVLLVDTSKVDPVDGQVFILSSVGGEVIVKRLIRDASGNWIIRSDNENKGAHPDRALPLGEASEHRIIGQVIWRGGDL